MEGIDISQVWAWLTKDTMGGLVVASGSVLLLVMLILLLRRFRHSRLAIVGRRITLPLVMAWEAQGLYILAVSAHAPGPSAYVFSGVMALVLATLAAHAEEHFERTKQLTGKGSLGWPGRLVWMVAIPMGIAVAFTAEGPGEAVLRLILPALVLVVWWVRYAPDIMPGQQAKGGFRFTPRRIFVRLGWIDPTDADLNVVHHERQVRAITAAALALHHGGEKGRAKRAAKLRKVSEDATPEMVEEATRRVNLVHHIERLTDPGNYKAPEIKTPEQREPEPDPEIEAVDADELQDDQAEELQEAGKDEPVKVPAQHSRRGPTVHEEQDRAAARELYVQSLQAGTPISGAQLARRFNRRYPGWGLDRIKEVRESINDSQEIPVQA